MNLLYCDQRESGQRHHDVVLMMSLIMMLLYPGQLWYHELAGRIMAISAILYRPLARLPLFWWIAAILNAVCQNVILWHQSDNHKFVYTYWYVAIACSLATGCPNVVIKFNSRMLLGLIMLFAVGRKMFSLEYIRGDSFWYLLNLDSRFSELASFFTKDIHRQRTHMVSQINDLRSIIALPNNRFMYWFALFLTWWTLLIEGIIAYCFLSQRSARLDAIGFVALMLFVLTVYPIAPVLGFGSILLVMAFAQTESDQRVARASYLLMFIGINAFHNGYLKSFVYKYLSEQPL